MIKADGLPDYTPPVEADSMGGGEDDVPYWGQDGVHDIYRDWHEVLAEYDGDRALCGEAWLPTLKKTALWVRPDEMHQTFNFPYMMTEWDAEKIRDIIRESLDEFGAVGAPSTWVLSNHDVIRHASRLALTADSPQGDGIGPLSKGKPDQATGLARARAATTVMLALPGSSYLYQGEELGLPEAMEIPDQFRQDPTWFRTDGERYGRDGCRVPLPWEATAPAYGFNTTGDSWLPQPAEWASFARDAEESDATSALNLYKQLLRLRRERELGTGSLVWEDLGRGAVGFRRGDLHVAMNLGDESLDLGDDVVFVTQSQPFEGSALPTDHAAWYTKG
jgi:alpha-glucosidase